MNDLNLLLEPVRALLHQLGSYMPRLLLALCLLLAGWLLAKAFRYSVVKVLRAVNFHVLTDRAGFDDFLQQSGTGRDTVDLFGALAYALALLASLIVAFNTLDLSQVTELLGKVLLFMPRLLVALLVLVFGSYFARFAGAAVQRYATSAEIGEGEVLGRVVQYGVMAFVVLLAIDHLDVGGGLIQQTFLILLGGVVFGLALAFGLGARDRAARLIERWFPGEELP